MNAFNPKLITLASGMFVFIVLNNYRQLWNRNSDSFPGSQ